MRLPEWNSFMRQVIRGFGGQQHGIGGSRAQTLGVEFGGGQRSSCHREHGRNLVVRAEQRFLVFLQVALLAAWQTLERGPQSEQRSSDAPAFSAPRVPA